MVDEPLGAGLDVGLMSGLGADGGEAEELLELVEELGLVLGDVLLGG